MSLEIGSQRSSRLKFIEELLEVPILSLKAFQRMSAFPSRSVILARSSFCKTAILLCLKLIVALVWKNFVFSSPNLTYLIFPLCFQ
jgi:hypothetical protein